MELLNFLFLINDDDTITPLAVFTVDARSGEVIGYQSHGLEPVALVPILTGLRDAVDKYASPVTASEDEFRRFLTWLNNK